MTQPTIAGDRFDVRRKLGEGGMGVVYEAFDRERGATVALKTLAAADAAGIYRLKKEFRALAGLSHPNLVALHELHRAGDRWFLVMELVNGVDFVRWVRGEAASQSACTVTSELAWDVVSEPPAIPVGSFDEQRLRDALAQLAGALGALHDAGRLHCDLKPSNVLVGEDGRLTILDFGIARIRSFGTAQLSLESTIVGTPAYMAPEQASGDGLSPATDWYSVGVMLYEALTGVTPFGGSIAELVTSKQFAEPPDPRELVCDAPDDLASLTVELLRARPEARPAGDDVIQRLLGSRAQIPARAPQRLWGRDAELAALREAFEHARQQAELVLIEGSPGVGKSALLAAFAASLPPTAIVLRGRCHERESMPYKAFDEVIDALARHLRGRDVEALRELLPQNMHALARVFPVLGRLPGVSEMPASERRALDPRAFRRLAFGALRELLAKLASDVVIVIDDLAWGDVDSAALLAELLAHPRLLVVGSFRSGDVASSPLLRCVLAPSWCEQLAAEPLHIALGPLVPAATEGLARELLADPALATALARESRGNPELVVELADHVHAHGGHDGLRLDRMLAARIATLSADARRLLEILAAARGPLPAVVPLRAAGIPGERSMRAVAELMSARLATSRRSDDEEEIDVYQAHVRDALEIGAHHHLALAGALEAHGSAPERIADHFDRAGDQVRAAHFLERAARDAEDALAFDRAAQLLRRALHLTNDVALSERLGHALANAGRSAQAAEAFFAAARAGGPNRLELERIAAEHLLRSGHVNEGLAAMRRVLAELGMRVPSSPQRALASLLYHRTLLRLRGLDARTTTLMDERETQRMNACYSMTIGMSMVDSVVGADFHARHLLRALNAGDPARLARALALEAAHVASMGIENHAHAISLVERAEALGRELGDSHALGLARMVRSADALFGADWRRAVAYGDEAVTLLRERCTNVAWEIATARRFTFAGLYYLGEIAELARRMPEALADARARGDLFAESCVRSGSSIVVWLARHDTATARRQLEEEARRWGKDRFALQHYLALQGLTYVDLYEGRPSDAVARLARNWRRMERSHLLRMQLLRVTMVSLRARTLLAAGDIVGAERDVRDLEREGMPSARGVAALLRAAIAKHRGDGRAAVSGYRASIEQLDRLEMKLLAAAARRRLFELTGEDDSFAYFEEQGVHRPDSLTAAVVP